MFGRIETLVSFSSVWYACVVARRKMMVWPGSCQVRCTRWKSRETVAEGFDAEKISSVDFVLRRGEIVGVRFLNLCLKGKYKRIHCAMYSRRQSIYLIIGFDGWERGMMKSSRDLKSGQQFFSKVYVWVLFIFGFYCLAFQEQILWFWELRRIARVHWVYKVDHTQDGCSSL